MNDKLCSSTSTVKPCGASKTDKASRSCQANGCGGGGAPSACLTASPAAEVNSNIVPCGIHALQDDPALGRHDAGHLRRGSDSIGGEDHAQRPTR